MRKIKRESFDSQRWPTSRKSLVSVTKIARRHHSPFTHSLPKYAKGSNLCLTALLLGVKLPLYGIKCWLRTSAVTLVKWNDGLRRWVV